VIRLALNNSYQITALCMEKILFVHLGMIKASYIYDDERQTGRHPKMRICIQVSELSIRYNGLSPSGMKFELH